MKYRHYETPMDWLKQHGKQKDRFLVWFDEFEDESCGTEWITIEGRRGSDLIEVTDEDPRREQDSKWTQDEDEHAHWRPFADIEALDSDDPILTTARINAES